MSENLHMGQISCVVFADSKTLITAGEDGVVSAHTVQTGGSGKLVELHLRSSLFGHKTAVTTVAVSKALSVLVTVSQDGEALLWDLNRLEFVRRLQGPNSGGAGAGAWPVECARVNDVTGDIMLCSGTNVVLFSVNGDLILDQNVCGPAAAHGGDGGFLTVDHHHRGGSSSRSSSVGSRGNGVGGSGGGGAHGAAPTDDYVYSCAFYEGSGGGEWLENQLIFTGHRRGRVNIWRKVVAAAAATNTYTPGRRGNGAGGGGVWELEFLRRLDHVDPKSETGANVDAAITCITPMPQVVYTGDEDGRVVSCPVSLVDDEIWKTDWHSATV